MQQNGTGTFQKWSSGVTLENSFPQVMSIKILRKTRRDRADYCHLIMPPPPPPPFENFFENSNYTPSTLTNYTFHKELTQCQTKRLLKKWCEHKNSRSIKAQKK